MEDGNCFAERTLISENSTFRSKVHALACALVTFTSEEKILSFPPEKVLRRKKIVDKFSVYATLEVYMMYLCARTNRQGSDDKTMLDVSKEEWLAMSEKEQDSLLKEALGDLIETWVEEGPDE